MKWNRNEPDTLVQVPPVLRIGITGGIGSGKSYVCRQLEAVRHEVFYCDEEAKRIIRHDATVQQALRQLVGHEVYDAEGRLVKPVLAAYLCRGREYAAQVDAIVHPRVAEAFARRAAALSADWEGELPACHKEYGLPARQHDAGRKPALPVVRRPDLACRQQAGSLRSQ